jgi:hypothetical protein
MLIKMSSSGERVCFINFPLSWRIENCEDLLGASRAASFAAAAAAAPLNYFEPERTEKKKEKP